MAHNTSFDSLAFPQINFSYNRILAELAEEPRFIRGNNAIVTYGGKLCKRPGTIGLTNTLMTNKRIDRLWIYETLDTPPRVYIVASAYDTNLLNWGMYYIRLSDAVPAWTAFTSLRQINSSTRAHEAVVSRGLFYVKGYPTAASGEKLGTIMFDGSSTATTVFNYWGILPPTAPAALVGAVARSTAAITDTAVLLNVNTGTGFPVAPFNIQVDFELMTVTNKGGGLDWTVTRGVSGTTAAAHDTGEIVVYRNWSASDHQVDVNISWAYCYAYKTSTGQVSSRSPLETNLDKLPSRTGPFQDLIPKFTITGYADTTLVPKILVFRSLDGGGTFWQLEEITNTGGSITYSDDSYESGTAGGTFNDPLPDTLLNTGTQATTLVSNSPPPTVIEPKVVGTDTPIASTPIAAYASRLWLGLGNILLYSGQEEITLGIPEECWPSGINGNFFRFQYPITNISATSSALYVFTLQASYEITGTNRETFNVKPIFENVGAPYGHPRAITRYEDTIVLLTQDFRIAQVQDNQVNIISDPLFTDLVDIANIGAEFDIKFWGDLEKEWLFISGHVARDTTRSQQWVYDIKKSKLVQDHFWFLPWTMRTTATASGRLDETTGQRRFIAALYDQDTFETNLVRLDPTNRTGGDFFIDTATGYNFSAVTNLFLVPPGNHVNKLRVPGITPVVYALSLDRLVFAGDNDPYIYYYADDFWSDPINPANGPEDPPRRDLSKGYKTMLYGVQNVAQRVAVEVMKLSSLELFECEGLTIMWTPDSGA